MIHVCFSIRDVHGTYSETAGVAIESMFSHTREAVTVHILHDDTLTQDNRTRLFWIGERHRQQVVFHPVQSSMFEEFLPMMGHYSIGTLFRLALPDLLPQDVKRVIYLDADVVVQLDIRELWDADLKGNALAACLDAPETQASLPWPCRIHRVEPERYFNAGVLLFHLEKIRKEHDLAREAIRFLRENPQCTLSDQDALNALFADSYLSLSHRFNCFTNRLSPDTVIPSGIFHFAGCSPSFEAPAWWDSLFLSAWKKTPWGKDSAVGACLLQDAERHRHRVRAYQRLLRSARLGKKLVFWGAGSVFVNAALDIFLPDASRDYFVDNHRSLVSRRVHGIPVFSPQKILEEKREDIVIIVLAGRAYSEIREQLLTYGFVEGEDFFEGRLLLTKK